MALFRIRKRNLDRPGLLRRDAPRNDENISITQTNH